MLTNENVTIFDKIFSCLYIYYYLIIGLKINTHLSITSNTFNVIIILIEHSLNYRVNLRRGQP